MELRRRSASADFPAVSVAGPFLWGGGNSTIEPDCAVDRLTAMFVAVNSQMTSWSGFVHSYPGYLLSDIIRSGASARVYSAWRTCELLGHILTAGTLKAHWQFKWARRPGTREYNRCVSQHWHAHVFCMHAFPQALKGVVYGTQATQLQHVCMGCLGCAGFQQ
jgi:hypothetical protein